MSYRAFDLNRVAGALGAEIGDRSRKVLDDADIAEIRQGLLDHQVIFFTTSTSPRTHLAFGRRFGDLNILTLLPQCRITRKFSRQERGARDRRNFGGAGIRSHYLRSRRWARSSTASRLPVFWREYAVRNMYLPTTRYPRA